MYVNNMHNIGGEVRSRVVLMWRLRMGLWRRSAVLGVSVHFRFDVPLIVRWVPVGTVFHFHDLLLGALDVSCALGSHLHVLPLPLLLPLLGPPVLEPDFHLALRELDGPREFCFALDGDVLAVEVLLLQFHFLVLAVNDAVLVFGASFT